MRIEGGYGVHPRWSDVVRRGKMRAYVSRVIEPEEYAGLSKSELLAIIEEGLAVDEGVADGLYKSGRRGGIPGAGDVRLSLGAALGV